MSSSFRSLPTWWIYRNDIQPQPVSHGVALMEGVAFHIRWICEALQKLGLEFQEMNAIGGGCTNPIRTQIISDVIRRILRVVKHPLEAGLWAQP